jgi:hypothetical protein
MKRQHALAGLALAALGSFSVAAPLVTSTFDSGTESWLGVNGATDFHWVPTGGQSGGYVQGTDTVDADVWLFVAPAAYKGDQSDAYGGTLSYYLKQFTTPDPVQQTLGDVKFIGTNGVSIAADVGPDPGTDWTFFSVDLLPGVWHLDDINGALATAADIQGVLSDVASLRIRGEYSRGKDVDGLDTVALSSPPPIPEPETYALMLAGLAALGAVARRRR